MKEEIKLEKRVKRMDATSAVVRGTLIGAGLAIPAALYASTLPWYENLGDAIDIVSHGSLIGAVTGLAIYGVSKMYSASK
jgi:hypothetical protein